MRHLLRTTILPRRRLAVVALGCLLASVLALPALPAGAARPVAQATSNVDANPTQVWTAPRTFHTYPPTADYPSYPMASAAVGDVTGDGKPDVVWGGMDGYLRILDAATGYQELAYKLPGPIQGSPVLVDLYGKGRPQVLVSTAPTKPGPGHGTVEVLFITGASVQVLFDEATTHQSSSQEPFFATPAYGDIDGDGKPEIVAVNLDRRLYAWHLNGTQVFAPVKLADTALSSPVLVDWNGDGRDEIVFGGDSGDYPPYPNAKGLLWSFTGTGAVSPGYPIQLPDQVVWSTPTVTDLLGNGHLDAVFGSGMNYPGSGGSAVYAYDLTTRRPLPGFPRTTEGRTYSNPVVADLNGDGHKEILIGTGRGWIYEFSDTGALLHSRCTTRFTPCTQNGQAGADFLQVNPAVADIDGDGRLEVVVSTERDLKVYDAATLAPENFTDPQPGPGERDGPITESDAYPNAATPTIAEVGGTAHIYLVGLERTNTQGYNSPHPGDTGFLQAWKTTSALGAAPWPTFKAGMNRRGYLPGPLDQLPALRSFVAATYNDFLQQTPSQGAVTTQATALADGVELRSGYLATMTTSNPWLDALLTKLYQQILGRQIDQDGETYWAGILRSHTMSPAFLAAMLYSSDEYYSKHGGTTTSWVSALYQSILGRAPDGDGLTYWVNLTEQRGRAAVAFAVYQSDESCRDRVAALYQTLLQRPPDSAGLAYWATELPKTGDLRLALLLANSTEYATRAITRFPNA